MVDDDIALIFSAVAQDIEPDMAVVIAEATRQGRRRRARRRLAITCSASASVVAVAVAATVAAHLASAKVHGSSPARPTGHRHAHVIKPKPRETRPAVPQAHGPGMRPGRMLADLRKMLPANWIVTYINPLNGRGTVNVNIDDGKGAVDLQLAMWRTDVPQKDRDWAYLSARQKRDAVRLAKLYCPSPPLKDEGERPAGALPIGCTRSVLSSGVIVMKEVTEADVAGYYDDAVYVARPDGVTVDLDVGNGTLIGTPHLTRQGWPWVDRPIPPGSLKFWASIAVSPKWHL
jgi:hypothetical protein